MIGLPSWLLIVPVLGALIFVHELGHFVAAKRFGIKVLEFGFGFPPRLFGIRYGETLYSINLVPLGGFVRMVGEEDPEDPRSFARKSVLQRIIVLSAGSFMNLLTPIVIFTVLFAIPRDTAIGSVIISGVAPGSPAAEAGLRPGDIVLAYDGDRVNNHLDLIAQVMASLGSETDITVRRGAIVSGLGGSPELAAVETLTVVPRLNPPQLQVVDNVAEPETQVSLGDAQLYNRELEVGDIMTQGSIGVMIGTSNARIVKQRESIWNAVPMAVERIWDVVTITKNGFARWIAGGPDPGLAGPIGIARVTGEVAKAGVSPIFELTALLSISLGIVNILPIPALDGGRLMFVVIEWVRRGKRISPKREGLVHLVGFALLLGFIVVVSYFDVVRMLSGESLIR